MKFTSLDYVMERYVGKRPELICIEAELEKLRKKILDGTFSLLKGNTSNKDIMMDQINESEENEKIQKEFKKLFQLKSMEVFWIKTAVPNASTPCKTFQILDKSYSVDKDGVDINPKLDIYMNVHTGLFTHLNMTAGEVLAIMLHEIGHNFYQSAMQVINRFNPLNPASFVLPTLISDVFNLAIPITKVFNLPRMVADKVGLTRLLTIIEEAMIVKQIFSLPVLHTIGKLMSGRYKLNYGAMIDNPSRIVFNYSVEKHADSFAVDYGYGPHMLTALNKLEQRENSTAYNIPLLNLVKDFEDLMMDLTFQTLSGYPTDHTRKALILKRLENAKHDPCLPDRLKKELDHQIKDAEKTYDHMMSIKNKENHKRVFTWTYRKTLDKMFGGIIDIRELLSKADTAYNEDWEAFENKHK